MEGKELPGREHKEGECVLSPEGKNKGIVSKPAKARTQAFSASNPLQQFNAKHCLSLEISVTNA